MSGICLDFIQVFGWFFILFVCLFVLGGVCYLTISYQVLSESLPLAQAQVIFGLKEAKLGWGRKNPTNKLTFRRLTLQCCHYFLTQFHPPSPQFIQNQALVHCPSHQLYARYHHP